MDILTDKTPIDDIKTAYEEFLKQRDSPPLFSQRKIIGEFFSFLCVDGDFSLMPPHPDAPIEEIGAYLTEKNRELYQRLADGDSGQDAPITPEFLEGLGFEENFESEHIKESGVFDDYICITVDTRNIKIKIDMGRGTGRNLPHIRTQSQLANLIAALFGEVGGE